MRAHDLLTNIAEAAPILGVVKQDIASAYGNLGKVAEASRFAQDAIQLVNSPLNNTLFPNACTELVCCEVGRSAVRSRRQAEMAVSRRKWKLRKKN